jgi:hypothetical protein
MDWVRELPLRESRDWESKAWKTRRRRRDRDASDFLDDCDRKETAAAMLTGSSKETRPKGLSDFAWMLAANYAMFDDTLNVRRESSARPRRPAASSSQDAGSGVETAVAWPEVRKSSPGPQPRQ